MDEGVSECEYILLYIYIHIHIHIISIFSDSQLRISLSIPLMKDWDDRKKYRDLFEGVDLNIKFRSDGGMMGHFPRWKHQTQQNQ